MSEKNPKPFKPIKEPLTKRENISTQLLAGMRIDKTFDGTQHPGLIEHYVNTALLATDLLLKKLGE